MRMAYETNLTDEQWQVIKPLYINMREHLVKLTRQNAGRNENPTYALIDSQSVKTVYASDQLGFDGVKN